MNYLVTLVADAQRPCLEQRHVEHLLGLLVAAGAEAGTPDWLAEGLACDVPFVAADLDPAALEETLRGALATEPLDLAVQPAAGRRKRLLVADMESTIIEQEMLDELGDLVGKRAEIAAVTERSMRGELNFEEALRERVALLAGLTEEDILRIGNRITLMPGAKTLVATLQQDGVYCALVSGGFTSFADPLGKQLGFDIVRANLLELEDGGLTGRVVPPILGRDAKLTILLELCKRLEIAPAAAAAVGDGANDLAMLQEAGLGVAFRAKPLVRRSARFRLDHADLTGLLFLMGYRAEEFVTS
ncbi:MAG TPA: phosphoserine phosphatase SerB [Kiloniellales bacterium]|nr:phosphoserine phosphatase SerB [Kiloniellales bacterium]